MCAVECRILSKSSDSSDVNKGTDCSAALTSSPTAAAALSFFKPFCRLKIKEEEEEFEEEDDVVVPRENKQLVVVVVFIIVVVVFRANARRNDIVVINVVSVVVEKEFEPRREMGFLEVKRHFLPPETLLLLAAEETTRAAGMVVKVTM
jgi:hypothetical protein